MQALHLLMLVALSTSQWLPRAIRSLHFHWAKLHTTSASMQFPEPKREEAHASTSVKPP